MKRSKDPLIAFDEATTQALSYLPWDYDRPEVPEVIEDLIPRATKAHRTISELMVLAQGWETGGDLGELMLLEQIQELLHDWR